MRRIAEDSSTVLPTMLEATVAVQNMRSPDYGSTGYPINTQAMWRITAPNTYDVITFMVSVVVLVCEA